MSLGFPHIFEEAAAHLFGVPHRHEHRASELRYKAHRGSVSPHLSEVRAWQMRVCTNHSTLQRRLLSGIPGKRDCNRRRQPSALPWQVRAKHWQFSSSPFDGLTLNTSRHTIAQFWYSLEYIYRPKRSEELSPTKVTTSTGDERTSRIDPLQWIVSCPSALVLLLCAL